MITFLLVHYVYYVRRGKCDTIEGDGLRVISAYLQMVCGSGGHMVESQNEKRLGIDYLLTLVLSWGWGNSCGL
jgi:hypothetical protein